jgi:nanoRNase/pAp phosphatase (c-di-AMP/oligoRNAs hydrolase)
MAAASAAGKNSSSNGRHTDSEGGCSGMSHRLLQALEDFPSVILVSHVHPDPDSLGCMMGLAYLIKKKLKKPSILTQDGYIGRAENQAMVRCLDIELTPIEEVDWNKGSAVIMVDSQPATGRHTLPEEVEVHAVIDHHEFSGSTKGVKFVDVRAGLGATCTLVTKFLMEQKIDPPEDVATALFYGIESELTGYPREATNQDDGALLYLYQYASKDLLAEIKSARLPISYFETLIQALQNSFIYDHLIMSWAGDLAQPESAAEIADFLIRFEEVDWSFVCGVFKNNLVMSIRTVHANGRAGEILQDVVANMGKAGGHDRRAGGTIVLESTAPSALEQIRGALRKNLLAVLDIDEQRGQRLVPRRELLQSLQS